MITLDPSSNVFICGPVASGKTHLLNTWLKTENRFVRFDYAGEVTGDPNVEHFTHPGPLLDRLEENPYYFRVAYHPGKNVMEHYRWVQRAIWMLDTPRYLAMDEYHRVCPQTTKLDEDVEYSLRMARHNQLGIIGLTQRPQDVHKLFVDSCRKCIVYRSQEGNFLDACANHWGDDVADCVEHLRPLVFDDVRKITKQVPQCVVITRDGNPPVVYDFTTDKTIPCTVFIDQEYPRTLGGAPTEETSNDNIPPSPDNGTPTEGGEFNGEHVPVRDTPGNGADGN
jgi:hypothetical protein